MKVYAAFAAALLDHGIDTVFGLMGDANMRYLAEFQDHGGRFVPAVHEGGSVAMADAWARVSGRVGVASVTHGPALTNTLTALVEAARSRTPLLVITGATPPEPTHLQRIDIAQVALAAGAGHEQVHRPGTAVRDLNRALRRAVVERRPIVLDLPIGIASTDSDRQAPVALPVSAGASGPDPEALDRALGLLASASRPIVLAGRGAARSGARAELMALADRVGGVLGTTLLAKELFAGEAADIGIVGTLSHYVAGKALGEADCVIAFGASLNMFTAGFGSLLRGKRIIHVDADPVAFESYARVDEAVVGDARLVAAAMNAALDDAGHRAAGGWRQRIDAALAERTPAEEFDDVSGADTVDIRTAMMRLDEMLPVPRTVVSDVGRFVVGVWPYVRVGDPLDFASMGAFGSIGLGLAGAIGATVARPGQIGVALVGDGGFMMSLSEFTSAVREKLPLVVVVLNDGAYGAEHHKLVKWGVDPAYSCHAWPDLVGLARGMGADGLTVRTVSDLDALATVVPTLEGPFLVDVRLDPDHNLIG